MVSINRRFVKGYPCVSTGGSILVGVRKDSVEVDGSGYHRKDKYGVYLRPQLDEIVVGRVNPATGEIQDIVSSTRDVWEYIGTIISSNNVEVTVAGEGLYDGYRAGEMGIMELDTAFVYSLREREDGLSKTDVGIVLDLTEDEVEQYHNDGLNAVSDTKISDVITELGKQTIEAVESVDVEDVDS